MTSRGMTSRGMTSRGCSVRLPGLFVALFVLSAVRKCQGLNVTLGDPSSAPSGGGAAVRGVYMFYEQQLPEGVAHSFSARADRPGDVHFQIWRPIDISRNVFRLVGDRPVRLAGPGIVTVSLKPAEWVFTRSGDRFAVYNDLNPSALAHRRPTERVFLYEVNDVTRVDVGFQVTFWERSDSQSFSATVTVDTDVGPYERLLEEAHQGAPSPTGPASPQGRSAYRGGRLAGGTGVLTPGAPVVVLPAHRRLDAGSVTAFYSFLVLLAPVRLQIWRPVPGVQDSYLLVAEHRHEPTQLGLVEMALPEAGFLPVQTGDLLGFTTEQASCPVGYSFEPAAPPTRLLLLTGRLPRVGDLVLFPAPETSYHFAVGLALNPDLTAGNVQTAAPEPATTQMEDVTSMLPSVSPHARPAAGGRLVSAGFRAAGGTLPRAARRTVLLPRLVFARPGRLTAFRVSMVMAGSVQLQVWRPEQTTRYRLVGRKRRDVAGVGLPGVTEIRLGPTEYIQVKRGDVVGFVNGQTGSVIGNAPVATRAFLGPDSWNASLGVSVTFNETLLEHSFGVAVTYEYDDTPKAPPVPTHPATSSVTQTLPVKEAVRFTEDTYDGLGFVRDRYFLLALFLWLLVLTVLLLALCCVIVCRKCWCAERRVWGSAAPGMSPLTTWRGRLRAGRRWTT